MLRPRRTLVIALLLAFSAPFLRAQTAADPAGHWEGMIQAPDRQVPFEIDLAKNREGTWEGTLGEPAHNLRGLPLMDVIVEGTSIGFHARADQPFRGVLSTDGKSISGDLTLNGMSIPVTMTRTGDAKIEAPAKSAPISKALEGAWNGTLDVDGTPLRLVLTLSNHPDGTATASLVNVDQGNLSIPVSAITQTASSVTLDLKVVGGSYAATLNKEGTELVGTFSEGGFGAPLTFRRVTADGKK